MREEGSGESGSGRVMLLTPAGAGAIAVVRLVGEGVGAFLRVHFDRVVAPGRCVHGVLRDGERVLDDPVVVVSAGGRVADISLHGGPWVVRSVMQLARSRGFDGVESGGGRVDESAVEGDREITREVAQYLPMAATELAVRALLSQEAAWTTGDTRSAAEVLADTSLYWLLHPPRVAIIGIPNVGKSTLANRLYARERMITADVPGTTRDWVGEVANLDGLAVVLVDTPGVRLTVDPIEREAIERSGEQVAGADLVVLVLDPTQERAPGQAAMEVQYPQALRVINKSDRGEMAGIGGGPMKTVATTGEGIDALREAVRSHFLGPMPYDLTRRRWWTERQRTMLAGERESP